jgi:beta-aspartyl-peptidase (threonine type)
MQSERARPCLVVHGGAGNEKSNEDGCVNAAREGFARLQREGDALVAVVAAVVVLEDDPRFNAGRGSDLRTDGTVETDAAVMDSSGRLGTVACLRRVRNPVLVARAIVDSPHWMLAGEGARQFARRQGFARYALEPHAPMRDQRQASDTVGAVARDQHGRFALASSTGGSDPAWPGRVGDTPIPGCGFWAGPLGAVSATGIGEQIVPRLLARQVYQWIEAGVPLQQALERGIAAMPARHDLGLIGVTAHEAGAASNRSMPFHVQDDDSQT